MLPTRLLRRPVTILTAAEAVDRYGTKTYDWKHTTSTQVRGELQPRKVEENSVGRSEESVDAVLYLNPNVAITAANRVQVGGSTYLVVGPPQQVHRLGRPHHLIVNVRSVEG